MRRMLSPNVSAYKLRGCSIVDATYYQKALKSLMGHQVVWGPNSCDRATGYVNFN